MAYVTPGHRPGIWKARYYNPKTKGLESVPAEVSRLWDGLERADAQAKLDEWARGHGIKAVRSYRRSVSKDHTKLVDAFIKDYGETHDADVEAVAAVRANITNYVMPYFITHCSEPNVQRWYALSSKFTGWLSGNFPGLTLQTRRKICFNLRAFGVSLAEAGTIPSPWLVKLPSRNKKEKTKTRLRREVPPKEILEFADKLKTEHPRWALLLLCLYFGSLRPGEGLGLARSDFLTSTRATTDATTHKRFVEKGLGSRMSITIKKSYKRRVGLDDSLKTKKSFGVVHVWDVRGARAIAALLEGLGPDEPLFALKNKKDKPMAREGLDELYNTIVFPVVGLKPYDLRRASGLYLGRTMGCDPFLLQDHLRNTMNAALLYTRRPDNEKETTETQNLKDVG